MIVCPFWICFFYIRWCDISPWTLFKAETTATMWYVKRKVGKWHICICTCLLFFVVVEGPKFETVLVLLQQLCQNLRVAPSQKPCSNYKPFTWHWHYTSRITISPSPSKITGCEMCSSYFSQPRIIQHLNQTYISIETWQNSFLHLAHRRCVSLYLHGSGREGKMGERKCTSLLFTPLCNW